jgi:type I restriction enzyme R subunit
VWATPFFEIKSSTDLEDVSSKIRGMLEEHLEVTGIATICKLRKITDPEFLDDFKIEEGDEQELQEAAIRKATELKKITDEKSEENQERYEQFSELVLQAIERYQKGQDSASDLLKKMEKVTSDLKKENRAHTKSGLDPKTHDIYVILKSFSEASPKLSIAKNSDKKVGDNESDPKLSKLKQIAADICLVYQEVSSMWQDKEQLRRELRGKIRRLAKDVEINGWQKEIPTRIEEYAMKHLQRDH